MTPETTRIAIPLVTNAITGGNDWVTQVTTPRGGRKYELDYLKVGGSESPKVPSVTSLIHGTIRNPVLENWQKKNVRESLTDNLGQTVTKTMIADAFSTSDRRAARSAATGNMMHAKIEGILQGKKIDEGKPDQLKPAVKAFRRWQKEIAGSWELVGTEMAIAEVCGPPMSIKEQAEAISVHPELGANGFAGTVDAIYRMPDGGYVVCDWKTTRGASGIYSEHCLQISAYVLGLQSMLHRQGSFFIPDDGETRIPPIRAMVVRFVNDYALDENGNADPDLDKVFEDRIEIGWVDTSAWGTLFCSSILLYKTSNLSDTVEKEYI